jgi:hypothetical protein
VVAAAVVAVAGGGTVGGQLGFGHQFGYRDRTGAGSGGSDGAIWASVSVSMTVVESMSFDSRATLTASAGTEASAQGGQHQRAASAVVSRQQQFVCRRCK